jgi:spore maturation protein CgeB
LLPGIPTIRVFEALACGIPLVCAPWEDSEDLFRPGEDYLVAKDGAEMTTHLRALRDDPALRQSLVEHGLATIRARHTCAHRARELVGVLSKISPSPVPGEGGARARSAWEGEGARSARPSPGVAPLRHPLPVGERARRIPA